VCDQVLQQVCPGQSARLSLITSTITPIRPVHSRTQVVTITNTTTTVITITITIASFQL
jgi:hypothetical protein